MKWPSPHGTTNKRFRGERLGIRNPMPRRELAIASAKAQAEARQAQRPDPRDRPRFASVQVAIDPNSPAKPLADVLDALSRRDPTMARLIAAAAETSAKRQASTEATSSTADRRETGPPTPD